MGKNALETSAPAAPPPELPQTQSTNVVNLPARPLPAQPTPSHAHTVAALRHFTMFLRFLEKLLKDPDLGKTSIRSEVIEGMSELVGDLVQTPEKAVQILASFPDDPQLQRKWIQASYIQILHARDAVLDHHRAANPGAGNLAAEMARSSFDRKKHSGDMQSLVKHYAR